MSDYPENWDIIRKSIYQRDDYTCQKCGAQNTELHCHHKVPVSQGGSHYPNNLLTVCKSCHEEIHGHPIGPKEGKISESSSPALLWWSFYTAGAIVISVAFPPLAIVGVPVAIYCLVMLFDKAMKG